MAEIEDLSPTRVIIISIIHNLMVHFDAEKTNLRIES
jgi:hypothetical protein